MDLPLPLRRVAWAHIVAGVLGLGFTVFLGFLLALSPDPDARTAAIGTMLLLAFAWPLPSLAIGILLLRGNRWGPLALAMFARLELLYVPLGTALGAWSLWTLRQATTPPDEGPAAAPAVELLPEPKRTGPLLAVIAGVGALFVVAIGIGFLVSGDPVPAEVGDVGIPAIVGLAAIAALAFRTIRQNRERAARAPQ